MSLAESVLAGETRALARLLTLVENDLPEGRAALDELFPHTGQAHRVGVTGGTGTGKSSLVNRLALHYRRPPSGEPRRVAIVAVDPSSPFTGGAVLGDRVRMADLAGDPGVFIRSMASRGSLGGLARATADLVRVFEAAGFDPILIETVGAGQAEVEIARLAHTVLVVEAPGLGDEVQAIKAGILEIADLLVVNKADLPGAAQTERALKGMLGLAGKRPASAWTPPVLRTVALDGTGVTELAGAIDRHAAHLRQSGEWERRERLRLETELESRLTSALFEQLRARVGERFPEMLERLSRRELSPAAAVEGLLELADRPLIKDNEGR